MLDFFKDHRNKNSLMRLQSFICFLVFVYVSIFKIGSVTWEVYLTLGILGFFPKLLQAYIEAKT